MLEKDKPLKSLKSSRNILINLRKLFFEYMAENEFKNMFIDRDVKLRELLINEYVNYCIENKKTIGKKDVQLMIDSKFKKGATSPDIIEEFYLCSSDLRIEIIDSVQKAIEIFDIEMLAGNDDKLNSLNEQAKEPSEDKGTKKENQENDKNEPDQEAATKRCYFFRGHENVDYRSVPSILREQNHYTKENELYTELQTVSPKNFTKTKKHLEILTEMQHFSLPTRLLDISSNPLSALFFATTLTDPKNKYSDGEIVVFTALEEKIKKFSSDTVEIQSSLAYLTQKDKRKIHKYAKYLVADKEFLKNERVREFNKHTVVKKLMHEASKSGFLYSNELDPEDLFKFLICLPLRNNARIANQQGAFISYGYTDKSEYHLKAASEQADYEKIVQRNFAYKVKGKTVRYIIPYDKKEKIQKELDGLSINQGNIYPDIEKRAAYIKAKYK